MSKIANHSTLADLKEVVIATESLKRNLYELFGRPHVPKSGSIASLELDDAFWGSAAREAQFRAVMSFEFALRNFDCLPLLVDPNADRCLPACVTCRSLIEHCATASWASDLKVAHHERCAKYFALRYASLCEQLSFAKVTGHAPQIEAKLIELVMEAKKLGVRERFAKNEPLKRIGLGPSIPSITNLCRDELQMEFQYRFLSGVAHGQPWAIQDIAYRIGAQPDTDTFLLERATYPSIGCYICLTAINAIAVPARNLWKWFGWDEDLLDLSIRGAKERVVQLSHLNLP